MSKKKLQILLDELMPGFIKGTKELLGVDLDYTPKSLLNLENALNKEYPKKDREWARELSFTIGLYIGEVFVRNCKGAKWRTGLNTDDPFDTDLVIEGEHGYRPVLYPCRRVGNFRRDRTDGLYAYYVGISTMSTWTLFDFYVKSGEWQEVDGMSFRAISLPKDVTDTQLRAMGFGEMYIQDFREKYAKEG